MVALPAKLRAAVRLYQKIARKPYFFAIRAMLVCLLFGASATLLLDTDVLRPHRFAIVLTTCALLAATTLGLGYWALRPLDAHRLDPSQIARQSAWRYWAWFVALHGLWATLVCLLSCWLLWTVGPTALALAAVGGAFACLALCGIGLRPPSCPFLLVICWHAPTPDLKDGILAFSSRMALLRERFAYAKGKGRLTLGQIHEVLAGGTSSIEALTGHFDLPFVWLDTFKRVVVFLPLYVITGALAWTLADPGKPDLTLPFGPSTTRAAEPFDNEPASARPQQDPVESVGSNPNMDDSPEGNSPDQQRSMPSTVGADDPGHRPGDQSTPAKNKALQDQAQSGDPKLAQDTNPASMGAQHDSRPSPTGNARAQPNTSTADKVPPTRKGDINRPSSQASPPPKTQPGANLKPEHDAPAPKPDTSPKAGQDPASATLKPGASPKAEPDSPASKPGASPKAEPDSPASKPGASLKAQPDSPASKPGASPKTGQGSPPSKPAARTKPGQDTASANKPGARPTPGQDAPSPAPGKKAGAKSGKDPAPASDRTSPVKRRQDSPPGSAPRESEKSAGSQCKNPGPNQGALNSGSRQASGPGQGGSPPSPSGKASTTAGAQSNASPSAGSDNGAKPAKPSSAAPSNPGDKGAKTTAANRTPTTAKDQAEAPKGARPSATPASAEHTSDEGPASKEPGDSANQAQNPAAQAGSKQSPRSGKSNPSSGTEAGSEATKPNMPSPNERQGKGADGESLSASRQWPQKNSNMAKSYAPGPARPGTHSDAKPQIVIEIPDRADFRGQGLGSPASQPAAPSGPAPRQRDHAPERPAAASAPTAKPPRQALPNWVQVLFQGDDHERTDQ